MEVNKPRIAVPSPTSTDAAYNARSLPQYARAIENAGGEMVIIGADALPAEIADVVGSCQGVLLPGSPADVDPQKYGEDRIPQTNAADPKRDMADELLLQDAHNLYKPILGICYGLQSLNVWRSGTLLQDIAAHELETHELEADDVDREDEKNVNHAAGAAVVDAHLINLAPESMLARIATDTDGTNDTHPPISVNSSHHQSVKRVGDGLRASAHSPEDGIIEAVESTTPGHFVLGVQWHPERGADAVSTSIFAAFVQAARTWKPRTISDSIAK